MSAVNFSEWAAPDLALTLRGCTFVVRPPSVGAMPQILAAAVRGEVVLGLVRGEIPDAVNDVLATIGPGEHPALGASYDEMVAAGIDQVTIDRVAYYAVFFWARGKSYADSLAQILWTPRTSDVAGQAATRPKG